MKRLAAVLLIAALPLAAAQAQAPVKVRIGQATTALSFLPIYAARALDSFKEAGVELEWSSIQGGDPPTLAALDSGNIDFAAVGTETALQAIDKGQSFTLVYSLMSKVSLEVVATNAALARAAVTPGDPLENRIRALKDTVIGVSAVRGAQDRAARWVAAQGGLNAMSDLKVALIGPPPAIRAAFEKGAIDAFVLSPPEGTIAERSGTGKILIRMGDEFPPLNQQPFLVLVAKAPLDAVHTESGKRVARALAAASDRLLADPAGVARQIQQRFFAALEPDAVVAGVEGMKDGIADRGRLAADGIQRVAAFAQEGGTKYDKPIDAASGEGKFWTNALLP